MRWMSSPASTLVHYVHLLFVFACNFRIFVFENIDRKLPTYQLELKKKYTHIPVDSKVAEQNVEAELCPRTKRQSNYMALNSRHSSSNRVVVNRELQHNTVIIAKL